MSKKNRVKKPKSKYRASTGISEDSVRTFFVRAIAVWLFVLPLIVHIKEVGVPVQMQDLYLTERAYDFFAYYKAVWLWVGAIIFFVSALVFRFVYKISFKPTKQVWALIAFAAAVILSFIFSEYKNVAWFGYLDRYEGTLSWLSYCMAAYAVHSFANCKEHNTTIIKGIVLSAGVVGIIGAFQFFKMDFFKTEFAKMLMLGKLYSQLGSNLNFTFPEGQTYTTLYNPNYVGSFVAVTLPLVFYMLKEANNNIWRVVYGMIGVSLLISLIGSKSTSGLVAVVVIMFIYAVLLATKIKARRVLKIGLPVALVVVILLGLSLPITQKQVSKINAVFKEDPNPNHFKSVEVDGKDVIITTDTDQTFTVSPKGDVIEVKDRVGNILPAEDREKDYVVYLPQLSKKSYIRLIYDEWHVDFAYFYDSDKHSVIRFDYFPQLGEFSILKRSVTINDEVNSLKLIKNEKLLSKRGYIWNRTVPKMIRRPLFGYGTDVFAIIYPQIDLLDKYINMFDHRIIIDKVHNTYLLVLINSGFIGLVGLLSIIFLGFIKKGDFVKLAIVGFLITSIINDSIISVTIILFTLLLIYREQEIIET